MVTLDINGQHLYIDGFLKDNLDDVKKQMDKDWDFVMVVDGYEGSGKSVLAQQIAFYLDPTLTLDRVVFNSQEFLKAIDKAEKYQAIIFDESYQGLQSTAAMTSESRAIVSKMAEIRQKNLFVIFCCPCFMMLNINIGIWRSIALLHVYTNNWERGYFSFYNRDKKKNLWIKGKKYLSYFEKPNFRGRFTKGYKVDEEAYREKKLTATNDDNKLTKRKEKFKEHRDILIGHLKRKGLGNQQICEIINDKSNNYIDTKDVYEAVGRD